VAAHYTNYRIDRSHGDATQPPQRLTETAALDDGIIVTVVSDSCTDSFGYEIRFTLPETAHAPSDIAYWTQITAAELARLELSADAAVRQPELTSFLLRISSLHAQGDTIMQCRDGSQPEHEDCSFESGGLFVFRIQQKANKTEVSVRSMSSG
jgi:hypothetical protein